MQKEQFPEWGWGWSDTSDDRLVKLMIIIIVINFLTPVLHSQGMKKLRYTIQKSTKIKLEWTLFLLLGHKTVMQWDGIVPLNRA